MRFKGLIALALLCACARPSAPAASPAAPPPQGSPVYLVLTRSATFVDQGGDYANTVVKKDHKHCAIVKTYPVHGPHYYFRRDAWTVSTLGYSPYGNVMVQPVPTGVQQQAQSVSASTPEAAISAFLAKYPQP
jgi:hypothetical protein